VWLEGCHSGRRKVLGDRLLDPDVLLGSNLGEDVEEELAVDDGAADRMPFCLDPPSVSDKCYKLSFSLSPGLFFSILIINMVSDTFLQTPWKSKHVLIRDE
jgi:hypothetical protein